MRITRFQQEATARNMIRQAYRDGLVLDDDVVARAVELAGQEMSGMIGRIFTREFIVTRPN
jgi:hypothetical protein